MIDDIEDTNDDLRHWKSSKIKRSYIITQLVKFHGYSDKGKRQKLESLSQNELAELIVKHLKMKEKKTDPATIVKTRILKKKPVR